MLHIDSYSVHIEKLFVCTNDMDEISPESLEKLRIIMKKNYGVELSPEALKELAEVLVGYAYSLYNMLDENTDI